MSIFESLENLNVSEECFNDIVGIVKTFLDESSHARRYGKYGDDGTKYKKDAVIMMPQNSNKLHQNYKGNRVRSFFSTDEEGELPGHSEKREFQQELKNTQNAKPYSDEEYERDETLTKSRENSGRDKDADFASVGHNSFGFKKPSETKGQPAIGKSIDNESPTVKFQNMRKAKVAELINRRINDKVSRNNFQGNNNVDKFK